jgi:hypothetical protein
MPMPRERRAVVRWRWESKTQAHRSPAHPICEVDRATDGDVAGALVGRLIARAAGQQVRKARGDQRDSGEREGEVQANADRPPRPSAP